MPTARELLENPDETSMGNGWNLARLSFGFAGPDICIVSDENYIHSDIGYWLGRADTIDELVDQSVHVCTLEERDTEELFDQVRARLGLVPEVSESSFRFASSWRDILFPSGRIWESPEPLVSWWANLQSLPKGFGYKTLSAQKAPEYLRLLNKSVLQIMGWPILGFEQEWINGRTDGTLKPKPVSDEGNVVVSASELAKILAKAHVEPQNLSPNEKQAVKGFRGSAPVASPKRGLGGWEAAARAQGVPFQRIGDSLNESHIGTPTGFMVTLQDLDIEPHLRDSFGSDDMIKPVPVYKLSPEEVRRLTINGLPIEKAFEDADARQRKIVVRYGKRNLLHEDPVLLGDLNVLDGHHRTAAAYFSGQGLLAVQADDVDL